MRILSLVPQAWRHRFINKLAIPAANLNKTLRKRSHPSRIASVLLLFFYTGSPDRYVYRYQSEVRHAIQVPN
jgi:hypothetical protein